MYYYYLLLYILHTDLGRGLRESGAAAVPPRPVQEQAVDVDSAHILWGRSRHVLPHHLGDIVAKGDGIQGPAPGQVGARRLLTHGGQKPLRHKTNKL